MLEQESGRPTLPVPYPPFLAFAPLDVWARFLTRPRVALPLRYWPRIVLGLIISAVITFITLPERLLFGLWSWLQGPDAAGLPGPVFILGYYRSGTTHLQFLLDRDPNLYSPKWYQALPPQGFVLSWNLLRFFLVPFLASRRPQDNVAFGSDVPAEDDFALNNWGLVSTLPGRIVVPRAHGFYDRFHDLRGLSPAELSRWRRIQLAFVRKLGLLAGRRRVVLKTPSHTARVPALLELFAGTGPKFIHITRHPHSVLRSNVAMLQVLTNMYGLQDPLPLEKTAHNLVQEYLATEQSYLEARSRVPPGDIAELRLQDLQADPIGEIKRVYAELGLHFTEVFEQRLLDYLDATRAYQPNVHTQWTQEQQERLTPPLEPLIKLFRHDQPTIPTVEPPQPAHMAPAVRRKRLALAMLVSLVTGAAWMLLWLVCAQVAGTRCDPLLWPAGIAIGYATLAAARRGTCWLGSWSALVTLLTFLGVVVLAPLILSPMASDGYPPWSVRWIVHIVFWCFMGLVTAYRIGSRKQM